MLGQKQEQERIEQQVQDGRVSHKNPSIISGEKLFGVIWSLIVGKHA